LSALNGATFLTSRPVLAPGMVSTLKPIGINQGQTFTSETASYSDLPRPLPLPRELGDVAVLVNDEPAPLYYVSPGQINFQMPMGAPAGGTVDVTVVRRSTGQITAAGPVKMDVASPGIFFSGDGPLRRAAVLNQDGSINTPTNAAARGSVISIFATGQGFVPNAPPDGEPASGPVPAVERPRVIIGTCFTDDCGETDETLLYSGLAPQLVGVWQINVKIPMRTAPDAQVPIALLYKSIQSQDPREYRLVFSVKETP
jgi:adhesin/invasin